MSDSNVTIGSSGPARPGDTQPIKAAKKGPRWRSILFSVLGVLTLLSLAVLGGYSSGVAQRRSAKTGIIAQQLVEQFQYALVDEQFGRYEAARQRLEFIIKNDPGFPGAQEELAKVLVQLTIPTPSPTLPPTPTPDTRGVEALFATAQQLIAAGDWANALTALDQLRKQDPNLHPGQVDGMYYFALRNYGVSLIQNSGDLEGGIYQLTLAERFALLDSTSNGLREGARAYIQALSYFGINWPRAVEFFRGVSAGWPSMWDGTMNANQRFRIALMRYGDQLWAQGDACGAAAIYQEAMAISELEDVSARNANQANQQCYPATEEPTAQPVGETPAVPTVEDPNPPVPTSDTPSS